jgi:hypothetical protein
MDHTPRTPHIHRAQAWVRWRGHSLMTGLGRGRAFADLDRVVGAVERRRCERALRHWRSWFSYRYAGIFIECNCNLAGRWVLPVPVPVPVL